MLDEEDTFILYNPNASKLDRERERSRTSKHISRTTSLKNSRSRLDSIRRSLHDTTRKIAMSQKPDSCTGSGHRLDQTQSTISPVSSHSSGDLASHWDSSGGQRDFHARSFIHLPHIMQFGRTGLANSTGEELSNAKYSMTTQDTICCLSFMSACASITAKKSCRCLCAYRASLDMRVRSIALLRRLIDDGVDGEGHSTLMMPVYSLFRLECVEGNVSAARCHAMALDRIFRAGAVPSNLLRHALQDDIRLAIMSGHRTLLTSQPAWEIADLKCRKTRRLHPSIVYSPLIENWATLRQSMDGCHTIAASDEQLTAFASLKRLVDIRVDLTEGLVMLEEDSHDRLLQAALCVVLMLLVSELWPRDTIEMTPRLLWLLREALEMSTRIALREHWMSLSVADDARIFAEDARLFAVFVGAVYERRVVVASDQLTDCWFNDQLPEVAQRQDVLNAPKMKELVEDFWPAQLLSCGV